MVKKKYYRKDGRLVGESEHMSGCDQSSREESHKPHFFNKLDPIFSTVTGVVCPGYPAKTLYDLPPRRAYN